MKKLALILGLVILAGIGVNAQQQQQQRGSTQMKDTTQMKKSTQKKSTGSNYQMNKGTSKKGTAKSGTTRGSSMENMGDTTKIKSKGEPVYKK
jgi:hypothetical protein